MNLAATVLTAGLVGVSGAWLSRSLPPLRLRAVAAGAGTVIMAFSLAMGFGILLALAPDLLVNPTMYEASVGW